LIIGVWRGVGVEEEEEEAETIKKFKLEIEPPPTLPPSVPSNKTKQSSISLPIFKAPMRLKEISKNFTHPLFPSILSLKQC
jgi:hypothetical protein